MVQHACERCGKTFDKKQGLTQHMKRKTPCENIMEKVEEKINKEVQKRVEIIQNPPIANTITSVATPTKKTSYKFIDLFCGIGGFHLGLTQLGCECVLACDIDQSCRDTYADNYGITPVKDVRDIDPHNMVDFDIICGGFPCFVANTKVLTHSGYKNIQDVSLTDKLMTHTGKFQSILNLQKKKYNGDLYTIRPKYHMPLMCTDEHPFYVREKERKWNSKTRKYDNIFKDAKWKKAEELTKNDYFGMKINENNIIPEFNFDKPINKHKTQNIHIQLDNPDMWFMMGYFIGDGWIEETTKHDGKCAYKIRFAINNDDEEYVLRRINNILTITDKKCPSGQKCNKYGCSDFVWFHIFKQFGKYAHGKTVPEWVHDAPREFIEEFIHGYHTADGCINKNNNYQFTTVSYNLAFGIQRLYLKLGHLFSIMKQTRPKKTVIDGRTVNQRDTYRISGHINKDARKQSSFIENGYAWYAPFKIEKQSIKDEPVYNFEVENDNSYIVENTIVHNCQPFSNGGKKRTFDDDRGLLFDEIMRIAKVKKPKFMFLENVKHILKVSNGEVLEYIKKKINDAGYHLHLFNMSPHNYGIPQQRERIYFMCVRKDVGEKQEIELPEHTGTIKLEKFMQNKEEIDEKYFVKGDILYTLNAWDEMVKKMEVGEKISPTILIHDAYRNHSATDIASFADWRREYMEKNEGLITKYKPQFDEWYKKHKEVLQKREIYGKLEWQVGTLKPNDSIFNHFIQVRQSGIRVKKAQYFPTLVAISQIPIYGKEKRYITPRECARLQCFPDSFKLNPNDRHSYKQFGNSVNVQNVKTVAETAFKFY